MMGADGQPGRDWPWIHCSAWQALPIAGGAESLKFAAAAADTSVNMNDTLSPATIMTPEQGSGRDGEILTVLDVARFLRVPKSTVYKLARVGRIPASKIGKHWRFLRRDIQEWLHHRSTHEAP